jgi:sulfur-carrier protein adenylyltransferase/sulfurtransferase
MSLTPAEYERYARHLRLSGFGEASQLKLKAAHVLVIGAGGLGSPLLMYLAAAGVGTIGIIDHDTVDITNLQRQILFNTDDTGTSKALTAETKLKALNPLIVYKTYQERISSANAMEIIRDYDLVADGSDNFATRYLVNDAAVLSGKPLVYGSVFRFEGQVSLFNYKNDRGDTGPNYRDLFPVPPAPESVPDCSEAGVLGVLPGIIGSMMALEVIKLITGVGTLLSGSVYHFDALTLSGLTFSLTRSAANPLNGIKPSITKLIDYEVFCNGAGAINEITAEEFSKLTHDHKDYRLFDVRSKPEYDEVNIGGRLIPLDTILNGDVSLLENEDAKRMNQRSFRLIFHCKSGGRSIKAINVLKQRPEYANVELINLKGGLDAYLQYLQSQA